MGNYFGDKPIHVRCHHIYNNETNHKGKGVKMDKKSLQLYYYSMIIYWIGSIPFILYAVLIKPIGKMYHEQPYKMISPVFGNFGVYEQNLLIAALVLIILSILLLTISLIHNKSVKGKISKRTIITPIILYLFTFIVLIGALI